MTKGGKVNTLKAVKKHGTGTRSAMSMKMRRTLGSGDLRQAVKLPKGEDMNDWLAANTVDFFNEVSLMYGCCIDDARKFQKPGEGFPSGVSR
jgi:MOB kinase activator 1